MTPVVDYHCSLYRLHGGAVEDGDRGEREAGGRGVWP